MDERAAALDASTCGARRLMHVARPGRRPARWSYNTRTLAYASRPRRLRQADNNSSPRPMTRDPRLTLNARQQELLEWVQRDGFVPVDDLASNFHVLSLLFCCVVFCLVD